MKKIALILVSFILIFIVAGYAGQSLWRGKTLSLVAAQKKWGSEPYAAEKFKVATLSEKSKMAASILGDKNLLGLTVSQIREKFGQPDGFYFIDAYPAYIIQEGKTHSEETWQIVFLLNSKFQVREVIVHKNCCD